MAKPHKHDDRHTDESRHTHSHSFHNGHHGHHHGPANYNRAFGLAIVLNVGFVIIEFTYGFIADSTALMADAGHNLSDVLGLVLAWAATLLAKKQPTGRYTYGLRGTSIMAALGNAMLLLVACGAIALEASKRFFDPPQVSGLLVSIVASAGIVINLISAWLFTAGSKHDLNIRGAFMHMAADAAVSLGVVIAGISILYTGWYWLDPLISLLIVAAILVTTWGLFRESLQLSLNAVPQQINLHEVKRYLAGLPGVLAVDDLHIWGMSTTENALTVQLIMPGGSPGDQFIDEVAHELEHRFAIHHSTVQIRTNVAAAGCTLDR